MPRDFEDEEYCPNCGQYTEGESVCPNCGAILHTDDSELEDFQEEDENFDEEL